MFNLLFKIRLFLFNLFHRKNLLDVKNIVCYVCGNEEFLPPLESEEEYQLIVKKEKGDLFATEKLIEHNLRLVAYIAKKFETSGIEFEDLISTGAIGLIKAVKTFKLDKNIRLATYASRCIENEILMLIRKTSKIKNEYLHDLEELFSMINLLNKNKVVIISLYTWGKNDLLTIEKLNASVRDIALTNNFEFVDINKILMNEEYFFQKNSYYINYLGHKRIYEEIKKVL